MRTSELVESYIEARRSAGVTLSLKTVQAYRDSARYAGPEYPPSAEELGCQVERLRRLSPHSEQSHLRRLRTLAAFAGRQYSIPDPFKDLTARRAPHTPHRVFSTEDYRHLRDACLDLVDRALLDLLLGTGIRIGEVPLLASQVSEVYHYEGREIAFITVCGKTGERYAPITARDRELLLLTSHDGRLWFSAVHPYSPAKPLTVRGLITRWRRLVSRSGLTGRKRGTHTARHTFASNWVMHGGSLETLQPVLGHRSVTTTEIYVNRLPGWIAAQLVDRDPLGQIQRAVVNEIGGSVSRTADAVQNGPVPAFK